MKKYKTINIIFHGIKCCYDKYYEIIEMLAYLKWNLILNLTSSNYDKISFYNTWINCNSTALFKKKITKFYK